MKSNRSSQKGVGLIEILVALLVLAIGILGFIALQYRAVEATSEAINRVQAMNIARDMAERIRANRDGFATYKSQTSDPGNQAGFTINCMTATCTAANLADFDVAQVTQKASNLGMTVNMLPCVENQDGRNCLYVAWGDTSATNGNGSGDCTKGTSYNNGSVGNRPSTCVIMETY
ncbi:type IV pilus modification protein PilV [Acinetobacter zhairhuonensis]|jgi:type IV pilus assembly protein PilV|uniref:type IV pilus modification protein PilV n=1 Tax=Acinetobacter sp. A7.4 TaxID=2919921 RepID=UPI001F503525|nr:type IV pilus modification protein PilV [Acinetobacter sp. A7.4]MCJ8161401.1 type IV pilus modification protein PilV [Acinetobacter sp. A7.4]